MTGSDSPPAPGLEPGSTFAGKYRIERRLGVGGMGAVFLATHLQLDELVAIKIVLPELSKHDEAVTRFLREARATIRIKSEHVARVMDVATTDDGTPYMVMEYLEGEDLGRRLERGPLPISEAVDAVLQVCVAIAQAHALGIVHRDLKPANMFAARGSDGATSIKVLDFGISKREDGVDPNLTRTQAVMGSPAYMAPEHLRSTKSADARSDIWSLGVVLYELCSGELPFAAETMAGLAIAIANDTPAALSELRDEVPPALEAAIHRCLAKSPGERFATIFELATALAPFGTPTGRSALQRIAAARPPAASQPDTTLAATDTVPSEATATAATWSRHTGAFWRPRRLGIGAALVLGLGCLVGVWAVARDRAETATATPPSDPPASAAPAPATAAPAPATASVARPQPSPSTPLAPPTVSASAPRPARPPAVTTPPRPTPAPSAPASASPKPSST
jgi:serine/threonine-protein kinase